MARPRPAAASSSRSVKRRASSDEIRDGEGGFKSLILPADLTRLRTAKVPSFSGPLLRLSIGLEDPADLIADLDAGFARYEGQFR